ncbi:MAG: HAD-IA family hydrolase [Candidatus Thioglobus sp.]|nr:HAD-IA family hydrolase [Candidatus Thioglobus sp.]
MPINTILFDLDGTLIDTAPDLAYALNSVLKRHNLAEKPYEKIKPLVAFGSKELVKFGFGCDEFAPEFSAWNQEILQIYKANIAKNSALFAGFEALLKNIKSQKMFWGIVTNKPENLTHLLLQKLGLKPDVVVCGDTLEFNKPHPAPLLYACAQLAVLPQNCLFVGDDKNDILAGKNAQITTVAAAYGYGKVEQNWGYDFIINKPEELEKWILD